MKTKDVLKRLGEEYPQLYLNPDTDLQETYKKVVLQGEEPGKKSLAHYQGDPCDRDETMDTPTGPVRVITLGNRRDFELVLRNFMAARNGPLDPIPESQGAAMLTVFNWNRIKAHLEDFPADQQAEEFKRFTSVKSNYIDLLVVLSRGPYSHVDAAAAGHTESEWLAVSDTIRRFHELTHAICRRMYPDKRDAVRDELVADAVGLYAAYGYFDPEKEKLFLGIRDGRYTGGRLENYTDKPDEIAGQVCEGITRIKEIVDAHPGEEPFGLIPALMHQMP